MALRDNTQGNSLLKSGVGFQDYSFLVAVVKIDLNAAKLTLRNLMSLGVAEVIEKLYLKFNVFKRSLDFY